LFLLVIGLIYDYQVARPGVNQAYDKIMEKNTAVNMSSTNIFTNKDVQELLAKQPSRTFTEPNGDYVEVYSWRSGLPVRTHDLFAVYKKSGDNWLFHRHAKFKHEGSTDISKFDDVEPLRVQTDGTSMPDPEADAAMQSGDADPNAGGADGDGPGEPQGAPEQPRGEASRPEPEVSETDAAAPVESAEPAAAPVESAEPAAAADVKSE
jgi:hypothetical protein